MRIVVLGHRGMLGHVVARHLRELGHDVAPFCRRFSTESGHEFFAELNAIGADWCINCIAALPQAGVGDDRIWQTNALLPKMCATLLSAHTRFIQPSTDGVFAPERPNRTVGDVLDASDCYGRSKQEAEAAAKLRSGHIIRCSLIGPELESTRNLLSWFLHTPQPATGFVNQSWNGITTLEFARLVGRIVAGLGLPAGGVWQPAVWPALSKFELLTLADEIFERNRGVAAASSLRAVGRTLIPNVSCPSIARQFEELRNWYPLSIKSAGEAAAAN